MDHHRKQMLLQTSIKGREQQFEIGSGSPPTLDSLRIRFQWSYALVLHFLMPSHVELHATKSWPKE
jgi:hypothetical protein